MGKTPGNEGKAVSAAELDTRDPGWWISGAFSPKEWTLQRTPDETT